MNKKELRKQVKSVLHTFNFKYLWLSEKVAINKCVEYIGLDKHKTPAHLLAENFFINLNNFHFDYAIHKK